MQNRLGDLTKGTELELVKVELGERGKSDLDDSLAPYEEITGGITRIETHIGTINRLKARSKQEVKEDAQRSIMEELNRTMVSSKRESRSIKAALDKLAADNAAYEAGHPGSTSAQMRKNMLNTNARHFQDTIQEFQDASSAFKEALKERIGRQARIVKEDITEEQIEELIDSPNPGAIFQDAVMQLDDRMISAVHDIEDRHKGMMAIEQGVKEIQELFQDMAVLVDLQQETLDVIERNIQDTAKYTVDAEKNITTAEQHMRSSRKKQCYMLLFIVVISAIIVLIVLKT